VKAGKKWSAPAARPNITPVAHRTLQSDSVDSGAEDESLEWAPRRWYQHPAAAFVAGVAGLVAIAAIAVAVVMMSRHSVGGGSAPPPPATRTPTSTTLITPTTTTSYPPVSLPPPEPPPPSDTTDVSPQQADIPDTSSTSTTPQQPIGMVCENAGANCT
jgi:hypothetical protein